MLLQFLRARESEFQDTFEIECQRRGIKLFVLLPRSPKLNGHVERAQRTHTEEFYEVTDTSFDILELNQALLEWEKVYNTIRPHQALKYLTPLEFLKRYWQNKRYERVQFVDCKNSMLYTLVEACSEG